MPSRIPDLQIRLVEASTEGFVVADETGAVKYTNPAAAELFGYTSEEMLTLRVEDLMPREHRMGHHALRESYHNKPEQKPMGTGRNLRALRNDGTSFYVEISLTPLPTENGNWVCALITDVDEKVKLHQENEALNRKLSDLLDARTLELSQTQQLYQAVARNYPNGMICVLDKDLKCVFAEGKSLSELRMSGKELAGTAYLDHLPDHVRTDVRNLLEATQQGGMHSTEVEHDGAWFQLDAVRLDGPNQGQLLVIEQDISTAVQALKKEKEVNEWMSRFVSMASHEFRTPLSAIGLSADLSARHLNQGNLPRLKPHLAKIQGNIRHLTSILNDFLNLERLETGKLDHSETCFDVLELMEKIVAESQLTATGDQLIHLRVGDHVKAHRKVFSLEEALTGILSNLLSNAIKYSPEGTDVHVNLDRSDTEWKLEVSDEGVGISKADLPHVFQRFFRAESTQHIPGTGVGLDLVTRYTHSLGGRISCVSEQGVGSTFTVVWPVNHETPLP